MSSPSPWLLLTAALLQTGSLMAASLEVSGFQTQLAGTTLHAAPIPLEFDRPDDKPGDLTKPIKV